MLCHKLIAALLLVISAKKMQISCYYPGASPICSPSGQTDFLDPNARKGSYESPGPDHAITATKWIWRDNDSVKRWTHTVHTPRVAGADETGRYPPNFRQDRSAGLTGTKHSFYEGGLLYLHLKKNKP